MVRPDQDDDAGKRESYAQAGRTWRAYDEQVTDLGPSLLIALSCLSIHWVTITALIDDFGTLPERNLLIRAWRGGTPRPAQYTRWANVVLAGGFGIVATALMVLFFLAGSYMTLIGLVELTCAGTWLLYLLKAQTARDRT